MYLNVAADVHLLRRLARRDTRRERWTYTGAGLTLGATSVGCAMAGGIWLYAALVGGTVALGLLWHAAQTLWLPAGHIDESVLRPTPLRLTDAGVEWSSATGTSHLLPWSAVRSLEIYPDRFELIGANGRRARMIARGGLSPEQDLALTRSLSAMVSGAPMPGAPMSGAPMPAAPVTGVPMVGTASGDVPDRGQ